VIAVSPTTRDALVAAGFASEQIQVVYNGVQKSQHASATVGNGTGVRIAYVGRLKRYKRIDLLLSAVARLRTEFPDIHLDLAGDGDARPQLEALIEQLQLQPHVTVHGFVDEQTKSAILRAATVFATPSMHEGWGLSVIEANAHGCPAVAYDVPGLRVAIRHGETGLLAGTHSAFEQALASILRSPALRERLSAGACKWAGKFSWESTALATLEVLHACGAGQFQSLSTSLSRLLFRPLGKLSKRSIS
jgi:glycosyltransferase involved in cell wall biosynthesis